MKTWMILAGVLILTAIHGAHAQETAPSGRSNAADTLLRKEVSLTQIAAGRDSLSKSVTITEFNMLYYLSSQGFQSTTSMGIEIGWLKPTNDSAAFGASVFALFSGDDNRLGAKLRYRRWLSHRFALDIGLGGTLTRDSKYKSNAIVGSVGVSWADRLHFMLQCEKLKKKESVNYWPEVAGTENALDVYAGVKLGREAGLVATGVAVVAIIIVAASLELPSSYGNQ